MNILLLGPERSEFIRQLVTFGDSVVAYEQKLTPDATVLDGIDFVVSYGYRHILRENVLRRFPNKVINLHVSLLPWNRGADPNLWSFIDDTPKGVSIHLVDRGVDTGHLLAQREVAFKSGETLRTSYAKLGRTIEELFFNVWPKIRAGHCVSMPQPDGGSEHRMKDRLAVEHLLQRGWDTPVEDLVCTEPQKVR